MYLFCVEIVLAPLWVILANGKDTWTGEFESEGDTAHNRRLTYIASDVKLFPNPTW